MTDQPIGVGIVGLGFGERVHLPGYRLLEDAGVRVEAVCTRDPVRARDVARQAGVPRAHDSWQALVDDPAVSLVSIAAPPALHVDIALAALAADKAVLCEKPLGLTSAGAAELVGGLPALVNFSYRALPAFRLARELTLSGALGSIEHVAVSWRLRSRPDERAPRNWKDSAAEGGGALLAYGIHVLDYVAWFAGPPTHVAGRLDASSDGRTAEDGFDATLDLPSGVGAEISVSLAWAGEPEHRVELVGQRGRLVLQNVDARDPVRPWRVTLDGRDRPVNPPTWLAAVGVDPRVEPFTAHAAELIAAIRETREPSPSIHDALQAHIVAEAITRSHASGRSEPVASSTPQSTG